MDSIDKPMQSPELGYQQAIARLTRVSDEMSQVLAGIMGYSTNQRVLLKASPSGILYVTLPRLVDTLPWTATGDNQVHKGTDIPCTEVLVRAALSNNDKVYVTVHKIPTTSNSMPLQKGESFVFSVENLREVQILIAKNTETAIVCYSI